MRGLDIGTSNLVVARLTADKKVVTKRLRNAFVEIDDEQQQRLSAGNLNAVHIKDKAYIVGEEAISIARILNKPVQRPMASGVLNPEEKDAKVVVGALLKALLGEPTEEGELCAFSIPAVPVDNPQANNVWHTGFFSSLLEKLGYEPDPINEALAIIYSECASTEHCGIAISHGAGQVNVAASYKLVGTLEFSIARSGDWIDQNTASATGVSIAKVLKVKEHKDFDLMNPDSLDEDIGPALYYHYSAMIKYELKILLQQWSKMGGQLDFPEAIPIILSGGTASLKGFKDLWERQLNIVRKKNPLPFEISEIRMAEDPFSAVAKGLLTYTLS